MMRRIAAAVRTLRPRTIAETSKRVAQTERAVERIAADLRRVAEAGQRRPDNGLDTVNRQLMAQLDALQNLQSQMTALARDVSQLRLRESQLRAIAVRDAALERRLPHLARILDERATANHVCRRISDTPLHLHPFPYMVVDDLLPTPLYDALLEALPPVELFADRPVNKRQVAVPLTLGPRYARRVWRFVTRAVVPRMITPPVLDKFRDPVRAWVTATLGPDALDLLERSQMTCSDGRILLRGAGYRIPPHRDPKWGFITCLLYLARPNDDRSLGTQLYSVKDDSEASNAKPHWVPPERCHLEATIEFHPNRALIFLNSAGAHGAQIPADAPASLERYLYQFRIGPRGGQIRAVVDSLPPEYRSAWEGKGADY